jgi:hypothetical protein
MISVLSSDETDFALANVHPLPILSRKTFPASSTSYDQEGARFRTDIPSSQDRKFFLILLYQESSATVSSCGRATKAGQPHAQPPTITNTSQNGSRNFTIPSQPEKNR